MCIPLLTWDFPRRANPSLAFSPLILGANLISFRVYHSIQSLLGTEANILSGPLGGVVVSVEELREEYCSTWMQMLTHGSPNLQVFTNIFNNLLFDTRVTSSISKTNSIPINCLLVHRRHPFVHITVLFCVSRIWKFRVTGEPSGTLAPVSFADSHFQTKVCHLFGRILTLLKCSYFRSVCQMIIRD